MRAPHLLLTLSGIVLFSIAACSKGDKSNGTTNGQGGADGSLSGSGGALTVEGLPDAPGSSLAQCEYTEVASKDVRAALNAGKAGTTVGFSALVDAYSDLAEKYRTQFDADLVELFQLNSDGTARDDGTSLTSVTWDPSHDAVTLRPTWGKNAAFLLSNASNTGTVREEALAVLGRTPESRYMVFSSNPFRTGDADAMKQLLRNSLSWLTDSKDSLNVVLAHLDEGYWFPDESTTRAWLDTEYADKVSYNAEDACDGAALDGCLDDTADLLVISLSYDDATQDAAAIAASVQKALDAGIPVMYVQVDGNENAMSKELFSVLDVSYIRDNYWDKLYTDAFDGSETVGAIPGDVQQSLDVLRRLKDDDFSFEVADLVSSQDNDAYKNEFLLAAQALQEHFQSLDENNRAIFEDCENIPDKLLLLASDSLRQDVSYPMSPTSTATVDFLRAYFSDHVQYNTRPVNPAQPDRGNFDPKDLSKVSGADVSLTVESRSGFRALGAYALPGVPFSITRTDNSAVATKVFVNTILSRATHLWDEDGYTRPSFISSARMPIEPGETLVLTSPLGGPIQIAFASEFGSEVNFDLKSIGQHAYWRGPQDDKSFAERVAAGTFNWVEIATPGFELHSRLDLFNESITDSRYNTAAAMAEGMKTYTFGHLHAQAAFKGDGIPVIADISDWAADKGLELPVMDWVKHGNMDQAGCGSGCSGNPYDAYWSFLPNAHGDLHELGHQLEKGRFRLSHDGSTYGGHSVTNWWSFYANDRHFKEYGERRSWSVAHNAIFTELQAAATAGETVGDFSTHMDTFFGGRIDNLQDAYSFYLQVMTMAKRKGTLTNGYNLIGRMQLLTIRFDEFVKDPDLWTANQARLGFDQLDQAAAQALSNNDFMAIVICYAAQLDYRDYFKMWGLSVSAAADAQIASYAFPTVERAFFALEKDSHTAGALSEKNADFQLLSIDGSTAWPL